MLPRNFFAAMLFFSLSATNAIAASYRESIDFLDSNGNIVFTKAPAPSVYSTASSHGAAFGRMDYTFDITGGPALSYVPVDFIGLYEMVYQGNTPGPGQGHWSQVGASFSSYVYNPDGSLRYEAATFSAYCNRDNTGACFQTIGPVDALSQYSFIELTNTQIGRASISGNFQGTLYVPTDAAGRAFGAIDLLAYAGSDFGLTTVFIDPHVEIDAAWRLTHLGTALSLPDGVGNEIAATSVPEPTTISLMIAGISLLTLIQRQRTQPRKKRQQRLGPVAIR